MIVCAATLPSEPQVRAAQAGSVVSWGSQALPLVLPGTRFSAIAAGSCHSLALKSDGTVVAWGDNSYGQSRAGLSGVIAIAAGGNHSLVLRSDGTVVDSFWGQTVPIGLSRVIAIAAGSDHGLALKSDGTVVAWGFESTVPSDLSGVIAIAAGAFYSLALRSNGTVVAFANGQSTEESGLSGVFAIAAGVSHSLALVASEAPLGLSNARWQNGVFTVSLPTQNGKSYNLQYKSALADSAWTSLPIVAGNGSILTLSDPSASSSQRFYRVSEQ